MEYNKCQFILRKGSILCCELKQLPLYMIEECRSYQEFKDAEYYRKLNEVKK